MTALLNNFQFAARFILISFTTSLALLSVFIFSATEHSSLSAILYGLSIPSYYYLISLLLTLLLSPLLYFNRAAILIIIPKVLLDIFLLTDLLVFNIYRFHIDMLFIEMAIFDFKGIGLSWGMSVLAIMICLVVIVIHVFFLKKAKQLISMRIVTVNLSIVAIFLFGQGVHIWGNFTKNESVLVYTPYMPYYAPITSTGNMEKLQKQYPDLIVVNQNKNAPVIENKSPSGQRFNYPIEALTFENRDNKAPLNVLMFVVESWRADMLTSNITPYIANFSKKSHQFINHYSGGNVTVSGLFSLMYGLNPSYLASAQSAPFKHQSMLTKSLAQQGYDISSYSGSNFNRFGMKPMFFW